MSFEVVTHGFHELEAALTKVVIEVDPKLGAGLRELAKPVLQDAQTAAQGWSSGGPGQSTTAAGLRIRRRQKLNVRVEQGLSKTTGIHGNYGGIQMRHFLLPASSRHEAQIVAGAELIIDKLTSEV